MKKTKWIILCAAVAALLQLSLAGCYHPPIKSAVETDKAKPLKAKPLKKGDIVYLFHSGTEEVKKIICVDETIPVYSEVYAAGVTKRKEVGKIKVLQYAGEHQFKAQVVEGEVRPGDIALKENAACLVYQPETE